MIYRWMLFVWIIIMMGCDKHKRYDGPDFYEDDFESYTTASDLVVGTSLWSYIQLTRDDNNVYLDTTRAHSGNKALKFQAMQSTEGNASKCSIIKQQMAFWKGETVKITAWYFLEGTASHDWLFLMDLEERIAIGAGPGMRLALVNDRLRVEFKFFEDDILSSDTQGVDFPRNQWVELVWEVKLSTKNKGTVRLWQNGQLIIDKKNKRTLPKDFLYFQQGTKDMYSSLEVGITANSQDSDMTLWVDDVTIEKID